jgi:hypothetical protein
MTSDEAGSKSRIRLQVLCDTVRASRTPWIGEMYVTEYEDILRDLREHDVDVGGFEIPDSALHGLQDGVRDCDRDFFNMRLAGLLLHVARLAPHSATPDVEMAERIRLALQPSDDEDVPF